ncbi:MAG: hypothetical protein ACFFDN_39690, partial [Candidatus Hodarchaeota archaeon]
SSINSIKSIIKDSIKIPVKIITFNYKYWEKLRKIINVNIIPEEFQIKEGISKNIDKILEDLEKSDTKDVVNKLTRLENKKDMNNFNQNNFNLDKKKVDDFFSFIDNFQKKIKLDLEKK